MNLTRFSDFWHQKLLQFLFSHTPYTSDYYSLNFSKTSRSEDRKFSFFNGKNFLEAVFLIISWWKARLLYYLNNWVYTTNHKRIAINYFWFVILSGIIGMVLATVIRLELAYPGAGIFAGDSLQYLSLVTAHGVIMVFFMIMPLLFGAFANFLLPTQLGVHDVAFPRLNSAAFWFLPSGLIMLAQLICVDRRYQRMNCFNIREVQALLKKKFFADLVNSNDYRDFLSNTMLGVRHRVQDTSPINPNFLLFYNYGTNLNPKSRLGTFGTSFFKTTPVHETLAGSLFFNKINGARKNKFFCTVTDFYLKTLESYIDLLVVARKAFKNISDPITVSSPSSLNFFKNKKNSIFLCIDSFKSPLFAADFFLTSAHYYFLSIENVLIRVELGLLNVFHEVVKPPLLAYAHKNVDLQFYPTPMSFVEFFWVKNYKLPLIWTDTYFVNLFFNAKTASDFVREFWLSLFDYPSTFGTHYLAIVVRLEFFFKTLDLYLYNISSIVVFFAKSVSHYIEYPITQTIKILVKPLKPVLEYYWQFEEFYMWYHLKHFKEGITLKEVMVAKFYEKLNGTGNLKHFETVQTISNYLWDLVANTFTLDLESIDAKMYELATFDYLSEDGLSWADAWIELSNEIGESTHTHFTSGNLGTFFVTLKSMTAGQVSEHLSPFNEIRWLVINLFIFMKNNLTPPMASVPLTYAYDPFSNTHYFFFSRSFHFFFFKDLHPYDVYPHDPLTWEIIRESRAYFHLNGGILNVFYNLIKTTLNFSESLVIAFWDTFYYGVFITLSSTIVSWLTLEIIPLTLDRNLSHTYYKKFKTLFICLCEESCAPFYLIAPNVAFFWTELNSLPFYFIGFYQTFNLRTFFFFFEDFFLYDGRYVFYANFVNFTHFGTVSTFVRNLKTPLVYLIFNAGLGDLFFSIPSHLKTLYLLFRKLIPASSIFLHDVFSFKSDHFSSLNLKTGGVADVEKTTEERHHRPQSPVFKYDYKAGDYFPKLYKEIHTHLFTTASTLTGGFRQAPWFSSASYAELFNNDASTAISNIKKVFSPWKTIHFWTPIRVNGTASFYNFFFNLFSNHAFYNLRWVSKNVLNQKFYRMFNTSSMQQRVLSNWRNLKFTREAWRCKLLSARHQKTLFRRYVNEDNVFWSIERNARDLLPGWAMITPFSSRTRFTAIGKVDIGLLAVLLVLNSSLISSANFLVTYRYLSTLNNRKMRDARSFFTEAIMVTSWMMIAANPMLVIGIIMLLSDRHWQTSFFDYSGGGDTVLFQHMFWFFGHPEVYIIIIPVFGFTNTILSYYLKKRISARASLLYSMYTIAFLGFFVWGHHMYMVGLSHTTRMLFSTLTVMISVPAATKLMHWCVTIVNSAVTLELPLICILTFIFFFISGGISGMFVAHTGMDVLFHDTFYVIGHFHVMLAGAAMIGCFGAFYFYFPAIFGVKYNRIYAYLHYIYYLLGQLFTLIPMFWLGYAGMPRRVLDYPTSFGGWHSLISGGHMLSVAGMLAFFLMIFDSIRQGKAATRTTFGVGRYNTRLNFYIYEIARLTYVQQKGWSFYRRFHDKSLKLNALYYPNLENLETTLYSYVFTKLPEIRLFRNRRR